MALKDSYLPAHGNAGYRVAHYDLDLDYKPIAARLSGRARLTVVAGVALTGLVLDLGTFKVDRVLVEGRPVRFTHGGGKLRVRAARPIAAGTRFTVEVRYVGTPRPIRTRAWGDLGWDQLADGAIVASQPIGAPSWFPCNDTVREKATYRITVTAPSPYTVVANGVLVDGKVGGSTTTWVYEQDVPMATYLATVQIGQYEELELTEAPPADVLAPVTRVTVAHRASGGLYRWEARYLDRADRHALAAKFAHVVDRVADAVRREHPLPDEHLRATAALGAIGSITMHHASIAQRRVEELLLASALRVVATDPTTAPRGARLVDLPTPPVPRTRRSEILAAAVPLFERDGFANVTNGMIAEAVGVVSSAIYRYFPGKADILAAACLQAAGLLAQAVEQNLRGVVDPHEAVVALTATYVAYSFEHTALTSVADAEVIGLPAALQRTLVVAQREHIAVWEQQLRLVRPELDSRQARVLVHAGFGVVVEAGRRLRWQDTPAHRDAVAAFVLASLGL